MDILRNEEKWDEIRNILKKKIWLKISEEKYE
jgi:hypothetical protein